MFQVIGKGGAHAILLTENYQAVVVRVAYDAQHRTSEEDRVNLVMWSAPYPDFISAIDTEMPSHRIGHHVWNLGRITVRKALLMHAQEWPLSTDTAIGTILPNLRWLPDSATTISVEIKPKCGFVPQSPLIHPENSVKRRICRYQLHQHLKLQQGKISTASSYHPVDLFGGNSDLQMSALCALLDNPQNNFKVWLNGHALMLPPAGGKDSVVQGHTHLTWLSLLKIVLAILRESSVLPAILSAQCLDEWDIEGIYPLYCHAAYHIQDVPTRCGAQPVCMDLDTCAWFRRWRSDSVCLATPSIGDTWKAAHEAIHRCSWDEVLSMLRRYLLAMAAKDCSIICAFEVGERGRSWSSMRADTAPHESVDGQSGTWVCTAKECRACMLTAHLLRNSCSPTRAADRVGACDGSKVFHTCFDILQAADHAVKYRTAIVDVDQKHVCRIPVQNALDQSILQCCNVSRMSS